MLVEYLWKPTSRHYPSWNLGLILTDDSLKTNFFLIVHPSAFISNKRYLCFKEFYRRCFTSMQFSAPHPTFARLPFHYLPLYLPGLLCPRCPKPPAPPVSIFRNLVTCIGRCLLLTSMSYAILQASSSAVSVSRQQNLRNIGGMLNLYCHTTNICL